MKARRTLPSGGPGGGPRPRALAPGRSEDASIHRDEAHHGSSPCGKSLTFRRHACGQDHVHDDDRSLPHPAAHALRMRNSGLIRMPATTGYRSAGPMQHALVMRRRHETRSVRVRCRWSAVRGQDADLSAPCVRAPDRSFTQMRWHAGAGSIVVGCFGKARQSCLRTGACDRLYRTVFPLQRTLHVGAKLHRTACHPCVGCGYDRIPATHFWTRPWFSFGLVTPSLALRSVHRLVSPSQRRRVAGQARWCALRAGR